MKRPAYIGDGVYVQYRVDGVLAITTGCHYPTPDNPGAKPDNVVYLEPEVLLELLRYLTANDVVFNHFMGVLQEGNTMQE